MIATNQKIETLPLNSLILGVYQRATSTKQVNAISADFDEAKLGLLTVSRRSGKNYILDGAHRAAALRKCGYSHAKCVVIEGLTETDEALFFRSQNNNRRPLSQYDYYCAGLAGGDELYVSIEKIVRQNSFKVGTHNGCFDEIQAIHALKIIATFYGYDVLDKTLSIIRKTWEGSTQAKSREFLVGVADFIHRFGVCDFVSRLQNKYVGTIWQDYMRLMYGRTNRPSADPEMRKTFCRVLIEHYNKGLAAGSKKRLRMED